MNKKLLAIFICLIFLFSILNFIIAEDGEGDEETEPPGGPFDGGNGGTGDGNNGGDTNNGGSDNNNPSEEVGGLEIINVNAEVDGESDNNLQNNEKISESAKEESDVELEVEVKNSLNRKIDDIKVTAVIENIDDNDDLEESSYSFGLESGDSKKSTINFELPLRVDDGTYRVDILAEGEDSNNIKYEAEWKLKLEVKKDKDKLKITNARLSPALVSCGRKSDLELSVLNLGRDDEDISIEIVSDELGLNILREGIELGKGADEDAEYRKIFRLLISDGIAAGSYRIDIKAGSDDFTATTYANIFIEDCSIKKEASAAAAKKSKGILTEEKSLKTNVLPPIAAAARISNSEDNEGLLIMALAGVIGVIAFLIAAIAVIAVKKKRFK